MVGDSQTKTLRRTGMLVVVLATFVALFFAAEFSKYEFRAPSSPFNPIAEKQALILGIVSSEKPLTFEQKDQLFSALSGPNMLQYSFTDEEKRLIVNAINSSAVPPVPSKRKSSAQSSFSSFSTIYHVSVL